MGDSVAGVVRKGVRNVRKPLADGCTQFDCPAGQDNVATKETKERRGLDGLMHFRQRYLSPLEVE